jgi:hypothetical protein
MAAMRPFASPAVSESGHTSKSPHSIKLCPPINLSRVRKSPVTRGIVNEGIYRIVSVIRKTDDAVGFLELQPDNFVRVVALNLSSGGQKVSIIPIIESSF